MGIAIIRAVVAPRVLTLSTVTTLSAATDGANANTLAFLQICDTGTDCSHDASGFMA